MLVKFSFYFLILIFSKKTSNAYDRVLDKNIFRISISLKNFEILSSMSILAASWRKRLGARLPPLESRVRVSVTPCGFRGGRNGIWVGFSRGFSRFPYHKFNSTISPHSSHPFRFLSSALVMVLQAWSAGTFDIH